MVKRSLLVLICTCISAPMHADPPYTLQETKPGYDIFVRSFALTTSSSLGFWNESGFAMGGANFNGQLSVMSLVFGSQFTLGLVGMMDGVLGFRAGVAGGDTVSEVFFRGEAKGGIFMAFAMPQFFIGLPFVIGLSHAEISFRPGGNVSRMRGFAHASVPITIVKDPIWFQFELGIGGIPLGSSSVGGVFSERPPSFIQGVRLYPPAFGVLSAFHFMTPIFDLKISVLISETLELQSRLILRDLIHRWSFIEIEAIFRTGNLTFLETYSAGCEVSLSYGVFFTIPVPEPRAGTSS